MHPSLLQGMLWGIILFGSELDNFRSMVTTKPAHPHPPSLLPLSSDSGAFCSRGRVRSALRLLGLLYGGPAGTAHLFAGILGIPLIEGLPLSVCKSAIFSLYIYVCYVVCVYNGN